MPSTWRAQLDNAFKFEPHILFHTEVPTGGHHNGGWNASHLALDVTNMNSASVMREVATAVMNATVPVISYSSNMLRRVLLRSLDTGFPWYLELQHSNPSTWAAFSKECGGMPWEWAIINTSRIPACLASMRPPRVVPQTGKWDAITAAIHPLFDRLFWPSSALLDLIMERVLRFYKPGRQFVIAVHLRVGTPATDANYNDPPRNELLQSVPSIAACGKLILDRLIAAYGHHEPLWYIATDRPDAVPLLRAALPGTVVTLGVATVTHTHSSQFSSTTSRDMGFLESYADHFLLSTAHAMIASPSGFSATARFWGRIPESTGWLYSNYTGNAAHHCIPNDYR